MTDWTTIADSQVDPKAPVTSELMTALRDNPIAIAEAAVGAPSISFAAIEGGIAGASAGAVGTYAFARSTTASDVAFGSTRAGSALVPTSAAYSVTSGNLGFTSSFSSGSALAGTWRCLGYYDHTAGGGGGESTTPIIGGATLWLRIS